MTGKNVQTHKDLVREYVKMFGQKPVVTGESWRRNPTDLIVEALDTGVPINERPVPKGVDL
jgi:hypothetical protein